MSLPRASRPELSVVIPVRDEEENLHALFERLFRVLQGSDLSFEVLCVNDGSVDGSGRILDEEARRRPRLRILHLEASRGQHEAILVGFRSSRGDWVVTLDADLQNPPEEIPRLIEAFREGHDVVGTYREGRQDPLLRRASSRLLNLLARRVSGIQLRDFGCMLRGYSRRVVDIISPAAAHDRGDRRARPFLPALGAHYARNPVEIPVRHARRAGGRSKYNLAGLVRLWGDLIATIRRLS